MKDIITRIIKYLLFLPLLGVFNVLILLPALLLIFGRKVDKMAQQIDSEVTSYIHKKFRS